MRGIAPTPTQGLARGMAVEDTGGPLKAPVSQRLLALDESWRRKLSERPRPTKNLPEIMGGGTATLPAPIREYLFVRSPPAALEMQRMLRESLFFAGWRECHGSLGHMRYYE